jgi:hypothetical protein
MPNKRDNLPANPFRCKKLRRAIRFRAICRLRLRKPGTQGTRSAKPQAALSRRNGHAAQRRALWASTRDLAKMRRMIHRTSFAPSLGALLVAVSLCLPAPARGADPGDAYENYVNTSKDFKPVKQDKAWAMKAFPSWVYMPWTFK